MPTNRSVWQDKPGEPGEPGLIRESPNPFKLEDHKLLVKICTWAMNPCDAMLQDKALPFISYSVILGQDVAGTVEIIGPTAASKFKVGDHVFGFSHRAHFWIDPSNLFRYKYTEYACFLPTMDEFSDFLSSALRQVEQPAEAEAELSWVKISQAQASDQMSLSQFISFAPVTDCLRAMEGQGQQVKQAPAPETSADPVSVF
ncbi:MAG: hypothetical protein FRX48_07915 [Lasallia pustulata]|uniref:Alcohol dehydrogenase-like N-terminal domain-containing protein n=1 Tax=Lasallia pustulata TaxID=136370 RepID=A0A5M8PGG2_9LECA|nr:MAG: hypothetical protein FRX48_07915 [Lasallia pustulata]